MSPAVSGPGAGAATGATEAAAAGRTGAAWHAPAAAAGQAEVRAPVYARVLRLRQIAPSGLWCFVFFEGAIAVAVVLALAELVSWWAVLVLPAVVAAAVKLNDVVAGALAGAPSR